MSETSNIEWTDATWSVTKGCAILSEGCRNCYAMKFAHRFSGPGGRYEGLTVLGNHGPRWKGNVELLPQNLDKPLRWRRPRKIFVNSMSDLFHEDIPNEYIAAVFGVMAACPLHTFQVLTKRAARMREWFEWIAQRDQVGDGIHACITEMFGVPGLNEYLTRNDSHEGSDPGEWDHLVEDPPEWPLPNVHLGVSAENQATADERIPLLRKVPAVVKFVSAEPLLGPVNIFGVDQEDGEYGPGWDLKHVEHRTDYGTGIEHDVDAQTGIDWVIVGGESGPCARPCDIAWIRSIVEQCKAADVPLFCKQLGAQPIETSAPCGAPGCSTFCPHSVGAIGMTSRKGGDPSEWPPGEWPREFPRRAP